MLNNFSNTVVLQKPPAHMIKKWQLATQGDLAHIVVMQNIDRYKIDTFIDDLKDCANSGLEPMLVRQLVCS
jgi:histidine decarboxylase